MFKIDTFIMYNKAYRTANRQCNKNNTSKRDKETD